MRQPVLACLALAATVAFGSVATSGCGTVLGHSDPQPVSIRINPDNPDAVVKINNAEVGKGSGTYKVDPKRESSTVEVIAPDGTGGRGAVFREVIPGIVIADAFMLLFPILIDYSDGGLYKVSTDITVNLGKLNIQSTPSESPPATPVATPKDPTTPAASTEMKNCSFCGEACPKNATTCPHCGQKP
jgi:hypothetical protein